MIVGTVGIGIWVTHQILKFQALTISIHDIKTAEAQQETRPPAPTHIYAQWFLDIAIDPAFVVNNRWSISEHHASYLHDSARPGEQGNIIIYGHNKRSIMGNIRAFKGKEIITITTEDGTKRDYRVTELHEVKPTETKFLQPTEEEVLTLYTCSGFWDRMRFIVRAKPV